MPWTTATNAVLVQAYCFTSAPIAKALVDAHRRRVKVQVILDHSQRTEKYSEADFLKNSGIPTLIDAQHPIAHNKIIIIDDYLVLTGSFNFTKAAEEHNAENLLVINDPILAKQYSQNWRAHERHSEPYEREPRR
jgi:phosphatidylserine/phosphatidylglycerophosphate/cardiolipin synthase-like enzyme